ncbi:MAG: RIP metalloprotease RseP [bacterium]|nr:RIP metalloprotease RseP [bacterium]
MEILITVLAIVACVFLFSFAVFIHEFGHFLAARILGLRVDRFSIGFGPALWKKTIGGVEYRFSAIPFGGYVALPQLDPEGTDALQGGTEKGETLQEISAWKRIVVAFAGPFGNIVLAVVLALVLSVAPGARFGEVPPVVGITVPGGQAEKGGLQEGDRVLSVDGQEVRAWNDVAVAVALTGGREVPVVVRRGGVEVTNLMTAAHSEVLDAYLLDAEASYAPYVGEVVAGKPAERAGLLTGDLITSVGDVKVETFAEMRAEIKRRGAGELDLGVLRGGTNLTLKLSAEFDAEAGRPLVGFESMRLEAASSWMPARSPVEQLKCDAGQIFRVLKGLVTPKETKAVAGALGGPVMIAQVLYKQVRRNIWDAFGFLRFVDVNLAILNLLPIPVLDGGLILFALFELLFRCKPPKKFVDGLSMGFMFLFLGLMIFLVFRDVNRGVRISAATDRHERALQKLEQRYQAIKNFRPAFDLKNK